MGILEPHGGHAPLARTRVLGAMALRTLRSLDAAGKRVFVRVDFNVPLSGDGTVADDTRIVASLPTIRYLIGKGARLVVASHLGRPKGKADPKQSLRPVRDRLQKFLRQPVAFAESIVGPAAEEASRALPDGGVLLLENLPFLRARGVATGRSLVDADRIGAAKELLSDRAAAGKILLPVDCLVARDATGSDPGRVAPVAAIPEDLMGVDIGPDSLASIAAEI